MSEPKNTKAKPLSLRKVATVLCAVCDFIRDLGPLPEAEEARRQAVLKAARDHINYGD